MKVALVYDRVNKWGGAERVLLTLHEMFPNAPLYTSVYDKKNAPWAKVFPKVYTTFLQKIPILNKHHEFFGWLAPLAFELFDFGEYDTVISITSEAAKNIRTKHPTIHICYMLTPTRYLWSGYDFYLKNPPQIFNIFPFYSIVSQPFLWFAKIMDLRAAKRPDKIIAISNGVQKRIKEYYKRNSDVVFPPVESLISKKSKNIVEGRYYLIHGRFEPYKRLDLVINVFNKIGLPLVVSGSGSEFEKQKKRASKNVSFVKNPPDNELVEIYSGAKSFIMPQDEDFGITSVEAQSFGVPIIAYKKGGALDTVISGRTGIFFDEQTEESLIDAIRRFEKKHFVVDNLRTNAKRFSKSNFKKSFLKLIK